MNALEESLTKAAQTASLLVRDIQDAHKAVNELPVTPVTRATETLLLARIKDAAALRNELANIAGVIC